MKNFDVKRSGERAGQLTGLNKNSEFGSLLNQPIQNGWKWSCGSTRSDVGGGDGVHLKNEFYIVYTVRFDANITIKTN